MTTGTTPKSPLDGLVSCGRCGAPMDFAAPAWDQEAMYACNEQHSAAGRDPQPLQVLAHTTDRLVISSVLGAVLTEKSISKVRSAIREFDEKEGASTTFAAEDISLLKEDPYFFLRAVRGTENARNFLAMFITRIKLLPDRAVIQYAMPLPSDSHLAGATEQEVHLSANLAA